MGAGHRPLGRQLAQYRQTVDQFPHRTVEDGRIEPPRTYWD